MTETIDEINLPEDSSLDQIYINNIIESNEMIGKFSSKINSSIIKKIIFVFINVILFGFIAYVYSMATRQITKSSLTLIVISIFVTEVLLRYQREFIKETIFETIIFCIAVVISILILCYKQ